VHKESLLAPTCDSSVAQDNHLSRTGDSITIFLSVIR
jgi:hypothetical protein